MLNRREILAASAATIAAAALPVAAISATPEPKAMMLYATDEPWGVLVQGHVSPEEFRRAAIALLNGDRDAMEEAENWFAEKVWDDDDNYIIDLKPHAEPEHRYIRMERAEFPEEHGEFVYSLCAADAPGAHPVSVCLY